jgi:hypothetical protein
VQGVTIPWQGVISNWKALDKFVSMACQDKFLLTTKRVTICTKPFRTSTEHGIFDQNKFSARSPHRSNRTSLYGDRKMSVRLFEMTLDGAQRITMHHGDLLADNRAGASPVDVAMQLSTS